MDLYLGIDGGATQTRAVLVSADGSVRGVGKSGPSNYHNMGLETTKRNLVDATERAWVDAGETMRPAAGAFLGCAGLRSTVDHARIVSVAESVNFAPAGALRVENDLHNALAGGLGGEPGIAVIAGTGSNCLGRDASGSTFMCGGWGWLLDDEGAGMGLALAGLRAVARAADGRGRPTPLLDEAMTFLELSEVDELMARIYVEKWTVDEIAAFSVIVVRHAVAGDPTAMELLDQGARALAALVVGAEKKLSFPNGPNVVLLGGCARSGEPYQPMIEAAVQAACPQATLVDPMYPPHFGAAINALRLAGIEMPIKLSVPNL